MFQSSFTKDCSKWKSCKKVSFHCLTSIAGQTEDEECVCVCVSECFREVSVCVITGVKINVDVVFTQRLKDVLRVFQPKRRGPVQRREILITGAEKTRVTSSTHVWGTPERKRNEDVWVFEPYLLSMSVIYW